MPVQLSLFEPPRHALERDGGKRVMQLRGRIVEYRFRRARRASMAMVIDADGLRVTAPMSAPWREIEAFLRANEHWIERKLLKWAGVERGPLLQGVTGETVPLRGEPRMLVVTAGRRRVETPPDGRLIIAVKDPQRRALVIETLLQWLRRYVLEALAPRVEHYAARLGLATPRLAASNARRQWGTCTEGGTIRLNWRLAHLGARLTDYVVAHEVSHLLEMNHSRQFWSVVHSLYPDWRQARADLERAGAALPRFEGIG